MIIKYKLESAFGGAASTDAVAMPKNNSSLTPLILNACQDCVLRIGWGSSVTSLVVREMAETVVCPPLCALCAPLCGGACFAAGTLVHTKEGLMPIEQIKVGDYVLSKPESGEGEQAYKRVTRTFVHAPKRVVRLMYFLDESQKTLEVINTTVNHPVWRVGKGWTPAEKFNRNWAGEKWVELADRRQVEAYGTTSVYISDQPGVGWIPSYQGATDSLGCLWDFVNHKLVATDVFAIDDIRDENATAYRQAPSGELTIGVIQDEAVYLKLPVYNLEVEDFHTYYVGKHGVWVHNKNRLEFTVKAPSSGLPALALTADILPMHSITELLRHYLWKNKKNNREQ